MRVLLVSNGYPPRGRFGTEFYTRELARALVARGHAVSVLHPERGQGRTGVERVEEEGVPVFLLHGPPAGKRFRASFRDARVEAAFDDLLRSERPDVVHFTYLLWGLSLRLPEVARRRGIASLATLTDYGLLCHRGQMFDATLSRCGGPHPAARCARCIRTPSRSEHGPLARALRSVAAEGLAGLGGMGLVPVRADLEEREREVRRALDALVFLIAPTRALLEAFAGQGVPREKLVHLVYSFDERAYRAERAAPPACVRFVFLGQLAPHKGLATLLAAAAGLRARAPRRDWELVLYGTPSAGRHGRYAERLLAGRDGAHVRLCAPFPPDDAARVLAGASALVAPSEWDENAPLAVLQARAAGLPVIATEVPGIAEIVRVPAQGRLVPVGDVAALTRALGAVLEGELAAPIEPGLAHSLEDHVSAVERLHAAARAACGREGDG